MSEPKADDLYEALARRSDDVCRSAAFFGCLATAPRTITAEEHQRLADRYAVIKSWQETTASLFTRSLLGELDPRLAHLFLCELPPHLVTSHQNLVKEMPIDTPMFFRTDEALLGKMIEVQCPGSMWGVHELLYDHYAAEGVRMSEPTLSKQFSDALVSVTPDGKPTVLHILDNISHPAGERYFVQRVRSHGAVRYYGYDTRLRTQNCNLLRCHSYKTIVGETFFDERRTRLANKEMRFDLPPVTLFDQKLQMCLPFWEPTRAFYSDAVRDLFPYTCLVEKYGVTLETGERLTIDEFCALPAGRRQYYLKYAGADGSKNWGSRAVYRLASMSHPACKELLGRITATDAGEQWMIQCVSAEKETLEYWKRDLTRASLDVYSRVSCFYGPRGLMGIMGMHESFYKVHGGDETIVSLVVSP